MSRNDNDTTGNLLDYLSHQNYYEHIGTDLSRQTNARVPSQTILQENYKKMMVQQCFLLLKDNSKFFFTFIVPE